MSLQRLRTSPAAPDFDQAPDYDEGSHSEFADDFTDLYYEETGQEYQPRKQK